MLFNPKFHNSRHTQHQIYHIFLQCHLKKLELSYSLIARRHCTFKNKTMQILYRIHGYYKTKQQFSCATVIHINSLLILTNIFLYS